MKQRNSCAHSTGTACMVWIQNETCLKHRKGLLELQKTTIGLALISAKIRNEHVLNKGIKYYPWRALISWQHYDPISWLWSSSMNHYSTLVRVSVVSARNPPSHKAVQDHINRALQWPQNSNMRNMTWIQNSMALSPQANHTDWSTATCRRNLVPTFVDRGVSCGQRGGSPMVIILSFLDRSRYFSFK
jgi:hypothetical protein